MSSLADIRDGIVTTLTDGLESIGMVYRSPGDSVGVLPAVVVTLAAGEPAYFDVAMGRGTDTWRFDLLVLVSAAEPGLASRKLDEYVTGAGPNSVRQAIWNNRTLGLPDCDAHVTALLSYDEKYSICALDHFAGALRLEVHTRGTQ